MKYLTKPSKTTIINHIRISFDEKASQANKEAYKYIIDNKLVMPGNFILTYHRFTGASIKSKFLEYSIYVNPEVDGFDPPTNSEWASSDWNTLKINSDPKKVAYIEKLKKEGAVFHQKLKEAFEKQPAVEEQPAVEKQTHEDLESKLIELKNLKDKGLITQEDYDKSKDKLLKKY